MENGRVIIKKANFGNIEDKVKEVFEEFRREWRNKKVLVKPNVIGAFEENKHVTTHPLMVKAVVNYLESKGAKVTVGDNPGKSGYGKNEECFKKAGLLDVAGKNYKNISLEFVKCKINNCFFEEINISREVLEADVIVSLPKFKTHLLTQITGGIKNTFGYLVGGDKAKAHRSGTTPENFAKTLLDIFEIRKPELTIIDGIIGMEGDGPTSGKLRYDIERIIASENAANLDSVVAKMMNFDVEKIPLLQEAYKRNLGEKDISKIKIIGDFIKFYDFEKPSTYNGGFKSKIIQRVGNIFLYGFLFGEKARLKVDKEKCTSCRSCYDICPAPEKAININKETKMPEFNNDKCIKCYCCNEICPEGAIYKTTLFGRRLFEKKF